MSVTSPPLAPHSISEGRPRVQPSVGGGVAGRVGREGGGVGGEAGQRGREGGGSGEGGGLAVRVVPAGGERGQGWGRVGHAGSGEGGVGGPQQGGVGVQGVGEQAEGGGVWRRDAGVGAEVLKQLLGGGEALPAVGFAHYPVTHVGPMRTRQQGGGGG